MDPDPDLQSSLLGLSMSFDATLMLPLFIFITLIILSGLISGSEVAFFSLKDSELEGLRSKDKSAYKTLSEISAKRTEILATILITNNFVNVAIVILGTVLMNGLFDFQGNKNIELVFNLVLLTLLLLLFGELIPKLLGRRFCIPFSLVMAKPMLGALRLLKPLVRLLTALSKSIEKLIKPSQSNTLSVDELSQALELSSSGIGGDFQERDNKMLEGILKFGSTTVRQVMTPRIDIETLHTAMSYKEVIERIKKTGYSRLPVYGEDVDHIEGILYIKDLLRYLDQEDFDWLQLVRPAFFVPESKKIDDLLQEFRSRKNHIAIVVDEYGGTSGIATLEDVVEEVVGEINDEHDVDDLVYSKLDENNYIFEGKTPLNDFCRVLNIEPELLDDYKGDAETLAGLLIEVAGYFPKINEEFIIDDLNFKVESIEKRRIRRLKVSRNTGNDDENS